MQHSHSELNFHDYENEIVFLRKELKATEQKMKKQTLYCQNLSQQLHHKNTGYNKKTQETIRLRNEVSLLQGQIDSLSLRVVAAEQEKEDKERSRNAKERPRRDEGRLKEGERDAKAGASRGDLGVHPSHDRRGA